MVATINRIGNSGQFQYFIGSKAECVKWLERQEERCKRLHGGNWFNVYGPARIVTNKEASRWRYKDGSKVIDFDSGIA